MFRKKYKGRRIERFCTVEWLCEADIGKNCFLDCTRLEKVTISDKVRKIVFDAFPKCKDIDITFI